MQAVILAGGKGTRLQDRLGGRPKPLIEVGGKPLLQRQIETLVEQNFSDILILVNHKKQQIENFIQEHNSFGIRITLVDDGKPKGTGGALLAVLDQLEDVFVIVYGDTLFNVDILRFIRYHQAGERPGVTLFVHPNDHPQDSDLIEIDRDNNVLAFHPYPHPEGSLLQNIVNAAMYVLDKDTIKDLAKDVSVPCDLAKHVFPLMLSQGQCIRAYNSSEYIKDVGTPDRLDRAEMHISSGRYAAQSLLVKQKAIFIDRDGTINELDGHINKHQRLTIFPNTGKNIKLLQNEGYRIFLVTNQPVVARGEVSLAEYKKIEAKLDMELAKDGAYFDGKYVCMHYPESGFEGEVPHLKIECDCRKPKPGLILQAQEDHNIDLSQSWMIGDSTADFGAAYNAGVMSIGLETGMGSQDGLHPFKPDHMTKNFESAVQLIIREKGTVSLRVE